MAVNQIQFTATPFLTVAQVTAANTNRDGTGTLVTVTTGTTNGRRISKITVKAIVTTTAGMVRLFIDDGVTVRLWREVLITAITVAAGTKGFSEEIFLPEGFILPNSYILKGSTHNAESFNIVVEGGDF